MKLSVVVPAYNEAGNIATTIRELLSVADAATGIEKIQVIVVDDHSTDETYGSIIGVKDPRITCFRLSKRSGSHTM